jgi:two-component system, NtrC family, nitrogen regulation response regulator NtrX
MSDVLVVDDDKDLREILADVLRAEGHIVRMAARSRRGSPETGL